MFACELFNLEIRYCNSMKSFHVKPANLNSRCHYYFQIINFYLVFQIFRIR